MSRLAANVPNSTPRRSGRKEPAIAAASSPALNGGNVNAGRSGHGRLRRPEIFTMRAASQRLNTLVRVENTAAAGGTATTSTSIRDWSFRDVLVGLAQSRLQTLLVSAEIGNGGGDHQRADDRRPQDEPADRVPLQRAAAAVGRRSREQGQVAEPPGAEGDHGHRKEEYAGEDCDHRRGEGRGDQPGNVTPAERSDHYRQRRQIEQENCGDRSGDDGCEQQRRGRASAQSDQYDLYHLELSRFISG